MISALIFIYNISLLGIITVFCCAILPFVFNNQFLFIMSLRSGFKITARDLRVAKFGKKNAQANCGRELEMYLTAIGKVGSEALIAQDIVMALTNCINAKVCHSIKL